MRVLGEHSSLVFPKSAEVGIAPHERFARSFKISVYRWKYTRADEKLTNWEI
jgi:hypothetical protein